MVPHGRVEEALQQAAEARSAGLCRDRHSRRHARASSSLSCTRWTNQRIPDILAKVSANGLPNLFIPARGNFVKVERLPVLGTGKLDLRALKRIAMERLTGR